MDSRQFGNSPLPISVLIVDDDRDIRETLRSIVEDVGYLALEARDGIEALDILQMLPGPLIVLTDHHMPRLNGPGLLRCILDTPALVSGHAYVYITAGTRDLPLALQELLTALDAPVLFKPLSIDELLVAIANAVQRL
jgi:CheY-like chemotaxis protein